MSRQIEQTLVKYIIQSQVSQNKPLIDLALCLMQNGPSDLPLINKEMIG